MMTSYRTVVPRGTKGVECCPLRIYLAVLVGLLICLTATSRAQETYDEVFQVGTGLEQVNSPLLIDLFNSPAPELVLTDKVGHVEIRSAETGKLYRSRRVEEGALSAPVAGDFLGDGRLHLAVGTRSGRVVFLDGATLEPLAEASPATEGRAGFTVQPLVISLEKEELSPRHAVVAVDIRGAVHCFYLDNNQAARALWRADCGASQFPPTYGNIRTHETRDVVVAARTNLVLLDPATGAETVNLHISGRSLAATPALIDLTGDGLNEILYANENEMGALTYSPERKNLVPYWPAGTGQGLSGQVRTDPVVVRVGGSPVVIQAAGSNLYALNPVEPPQMLWPAKGKSMPGAVFTYLSVVPRESGPPAIAFADERKNVWLLSTSDGQNLLDPASGMSRAFGFEGLFQNTPLVTGCVSEEGLVSFWGATTEKSRLVRFDLLLANVRTSPNSVGWATRGGNLWHTGQANDTEYLAWKGQQERRLAASTNEYVETYSQAREAGEHDAALAAARWLVRFDPYNKEYTGYYRSAWISRNLLYLLLGTALAVLVIGFTSWKLVQAFSRRYRVKKAEEARAAGNLEESRTHYERVLKRYPRDPRLNTALAQVYVAQKDFGSETLPVYQRATESNAGDENLLHAYARALAEVPETTDEAMEVYQKTIGNSPQPALMEFALGCCYRAREEWGEAAKHLRSALRSRFEDERVFSALCDVYLAMDFRQAKAVPIFKQQYPRRQSDARFLEAFVDACSDAKLLDDFAEQLCRRLLELNPQYIGAHCLLSRIQLQSRDLKAAAAAVDKALEIDPEHPEALLLRSQIHMLEGRTGDAAVDIYFKTLQHHPDQPEVLRALAGILATRERFDTEAVDVYRRSARQNPSDAPTLRALAEVGHLMNDPYQTIEAIERLGELGQMNPELTIRLAEAYVEADHREASGERVLRDALRQQPENEAFARQLAFILAAQDKTDADAIPTYERAAKELPEDIVLGRQLVKSYNRNERYSQALELAQRLLKLVPEDEELKRLLALSSLYGNKIDDAIQEYKQILTRNPNDSEALVNLALAFAQKGRIDDAAARCYQQALELNPDNENLHLILARVHAAKGDLVRCVESYQKALKSRPRVEDKVLSHCEALLNEYPQATRVRWFYCEVLVAYNRLREAVDQLGIIFDSNPDLGKNVLVAIDRILNKDRRNITALLKRGEILMRMGHPEEARPALERVFTLQPNSPEIQTILIRCYEACLTQQDDAEVRFRLGKLHFLVQDYDKAIGCFQRTSQDYRWEADSAKMLGKCFVGKGMLDLALQEFKKLVVDDETKELLYDLAQRYETKRDLVGAKTVYRQLFAADINYRDVKQRFEMLSGSTSDPVAFEKTSIVQEMSEEAKRRYELLDELGRGAMGIVYRAKDRELDEVVALKILPDNLSNNPEAVRRFRVEARNARRLAHPSIVRIHDIGEEMGRKYISMELVEGTDLKRRIRTKGRLSLKDALEYSICVADALAYAHRLGIVHRDIKPANVMITKKNEVKITDFGIAKVMDSTGEGTMAGAVIGTPLYMSPEQVEGVPVDHRADIYSFGVMLYEFVAGKPPFTEGDLAYQHIHKPPDPIGDCPPELWSVIEKCLKKRREDRFTTADDVLEELKQVATGMGYA